MEVNIYMRHLDDREAAKDHADMLRRAGYVEISVSKDETGQWATRGRRPDIEGDGESLSTAGQAIRHPVDPQDLP